MTNKMPVNQGRRADRIGFEDTLGAKFPRRAKRRENFLSAPPISSLLLGR